MAWSERLRKITAQRSHGATASQTAERELSPADLQLRQTLLQILGAEATGDFDDALQKTAAALAARPEKTLFRLAQCYLESRRGAHTETSQ